MRKIIAFVCSYSRLLAASLCGLFVLTLLSPGTVAALAQSGASPSGPEPILQTGHTQFVASVALSWDGHFLVSASADNTVKIWDTASGSVLRTLSGHTQPVNAVTISPDGRLIASGGADASVRVWDVITGDARVFGNHIQEVKALAFSLDGRQLVSLSDEAAKQWDVASGKEVHSTTLIEDTDNVRLARSGTTTVSKTTAALSADGRLAAIGGEPLRNQVTSFGIVKRYLPFKVVEVATGREIESLTLGGDLPGPSDLAFSPDGRLLAAKFMATRLAIDRITEDMVIVYDLTTGREVKKFPTGDSSGTGGIAFSPDGKLFASRRYMAKTSSALGEDTNPGAIKLFDVATWNEVRDLRKAGSSLDITRISFFATRLQFSANGKLLAAPLGNGAVLFDVASGSRLRALQTTEKTSAVTMTQKNQQQAVYEKMLQLVDPDQMRQLKEMMRGVVTAQPPGPAGAGGPDLITGSNINFSADGKLLSSRGTSIMWDVVAGMPRPIPDTQTVDWTANPTGQDIFSVDGKLSAAVGADNNTAIITIKETATPRTVRRITINNSAISGLRQGYSMVSGIALGGRGLVVQICGTKPVAPDAIYSRPNQAFAAQVCYFKTFNVSTGQEMGELRIEHDEYRPLGFDGHMLMSPHADFLVATIMESSDPYGGTPPRVTTPKQHYKSRLIDLNSGRTIWEVESEGQDRVPPHFIFSPDSNMLAIAGSDNGQSVINFYDTASGRKLATLNAGDRRITPLNFSRDGKRLATTYSYGTPSYNRVGPKTTTDEHLVAIWDAATGKHLHTLTHNAIVTGATFHPTAKLIATLDQERSQHLWDTETGKKLATIVNLDVLGGYLSSSNNEWLVVTPDGLFDGSPAAWQQIMWRFSNNTFDVGPVEIFFNEFYYPGLLSDIFSGKRPKAARNLQQIDRRQPKLNLAINLAPGDEVKSRTITVKIEVAEAPADSRRPQGSGARDVRLFRNGTLVKLWRGDMLKGKKQVVLEATLPIVAGENHLTAYAFNNDKVKSADAFLKVTGSESLRRKGVAYVLAFGVNQYANPQYNLKYAVADAKRFADEVKAQQMKLQQFERVEVITMLDQDATKENLLLALKRLAGDSQTSAASPAALSRLQPAQPEDAVMIYFAGHGTAQGARFYLVPHDLGYTGSRTALTAEAVQTILAHSVSDLELEAAVADLDAGQMLLIIDACNSGQALEAEEKRRGPMNSRGLAQLAYEKGIYILTAAQSYQAALEAAQLGHGYLTFALVEEGLKSGKADREQKDGQVLVREWFNYATERVPEIQEQNNNSRLLLEEDDKVKDASRPRNLQRPRPFYRREPEAVPLIIAKP